MEEYSDILTSPTGVPVHYQVKHSIHITMGAPQPNGTIYRCSVIENDEIKRQIQELLHKGHINPSASQTLRCVEDFLQIQGGPFRIAGHAFRVYECSCNPHEVDEQHLVSLHQLIYDSLFGLHIDLQQELRREPAPYSTSPPNPVTTQVVCQFGEMHFWYDQVQYLGYIIDEQGVHVDLTKLQVIQDWPAPTTLIELHNFLGLANF
eukprot:PITA_33220